MTRLRGLAACVVAGTVVLAATPPSLAQRGAREQRVSVSVVGRNDAPVADLRAADFVVREDGIAREVLRLAPAPPPSHVGLVIDDSQATQSAVADIRRSLSALALAAQNADPRPLVGLRTFGDRSTRVAAYSPSAETLQPSIDRLFARPGSGAYLLDAIIDECADLVQLKAERPVIIVLVAEAGQEFSHNVHQRVEAALRDAGASLWTLTLQGRQVDSLGSPELRERSIVLTDVAAASGGAARNVLTSQGLEQAMTRVINRIGARYELTYSRPDALIPPERLEVTVSRPGAQISAPSWPSR
jgi:hypothetical protein